jgi:TetR/AcrR family transcriptional repressor of nem operon
VLNTAVDTDDGNVVLRDLALEALEKWRERLQSIVETGIQKKEIKRRVDPKALATLIISSLEGALMISRLEKRRDALQSIQSHLVSHLESAVRRR